MTKRKGRKQKSRRQKRKTGLIRVVLYGLGLLLLVLVGWLGWLDYQLVERFQTRHLGTPVQVYSTPVEWFPGSPVSMDAAESTLAALGYRANTALPRAGFYRRKAATIQLRRRAFLHADGEVGTRDVTITFANRRITDIRNTSGPSGAASLLLDPVLIGSVDAKAGQDRKILRLHEVPDDFLKVLLLVEDRNFSSHHGIDPWAIARAVLANLRKGRLSQGGSTITQQLVKNLYLSPERSLKRKLTEALYAVLLELHYEKHEILEAYINEVFLAQAGPRAIHGFGLASEFFFKRPLAELDIHEYALLVGMVKAPSSYNPQRNPKRAVQRREVVLSLLAREGVISSPQLEKLKKAPLGVVVSSSSGAKPYVAFLDLVRRQLDFSVIEADHSSYTRVWSTMDLPAQQVVETALARGLDRLEQQRSIKPGTLQGAAVVLRAENGQVLALVGDRKPGYAGFNRALDAKRPVGSMLKPVVALTAFESGGFNAISPISDRSFDWKQPNGSVWRPRNYDGKDHGDVQLVDVVARSYNVATARLGRDIGVDRITGRINDLNPELNVESLPSVLLGAVEMSPLELAGVYLPFASGGLRMPLRGYTRVTDDKQRILHNNPARTGRVIEPAHHFLAHRVLQEVVESGTASTVLGGFGERFSLAGKTGTTDDYRDSWFAGYSGNYLVAVWIGRDDNASTGLSGASGALPIWRDIMARLPNRPAEFDVPPGVSVYEVGRVDNGAKDCDNKRALAFTETGPPPRQLLCGRRAIVSKPKEEKAGLGWLRKLFKKGDPVSNEQYSEKR